MLRGKRLTPGGLAIKACGQNGRPQNPRVWLPPLWPAAGEIFALLTIKGSRMRVLQELAGLP